MSVGCTPGFRNVGQCVMVSDAPASSRSLLVIGAVQSPWYRPLGRKWNASPASGALPSAPMARHRQSSERSEKKLNLFRAEACHVTRTALDSYHWKRSPGRDRSGVYKGVPCVLFQKFPAIRWPLPHSRSDAKNHSLSFLMGPPKVTPVS